MSALRMHKVSLDELAATPPDGRIVLVYRDRWWVVSEDNCVFFYGQRFGSPQCNRSKAIAEKVASHGLVDEPYHLEQVPVLYIPVDVRDYA